MNAANPSITCCSQSPFCGVGVVAGRVTCTDGVRVMVAILVGSSEVPPGGLGGGSSLTSTVGEKIGEGNGEEDGRGDGLDVGNGLGLGVGDVLWLLAP